MLQSTKLKKDNKRLLAENEKLRNSIDSKEKELLKLDEEIKKLEASVSKLEESISGVTNKLREQTEADLIISTIKLLSSIVKDEKPTELEIDNHRRLMAQYQYSQQMGASLLGQYNRFLGGGLLAGLFPSSR